MATLAEVRQSLATAVTAAGITCLPYGEDNPSPPIAWVDDISIDFSAGTLTSFCAAGIAEADIVVISQRHDRPGAVQHLEGLVEPIITALNDVDDLLVTGMASGTTAVGGVDLPSTTYTVQFPM